LKRHTLKIGIAGLLLAGLIFGGCKSKEAEKSADVKPSPQTNAEPARPETVVRVTQNGLTLQLLPAEPNVNDTIQAIVQGASGPVTYSWERNGEPLDATGPLLPAHSAAQGDTVRLTVQNQSRDISAEVTLVNAPPVVVSVGFKNPDIYRGVDIELEPEAADPDGDEVSFEYSWLLNGEPLTFQDSAVLPGDQFSRGDTVTVDVIPTDGLDTGKPFRGRELVIPDAPPQIVSQPPTEFDGMQYHYSVEAFDPDDDSFSFSLEEGPEGASINKETGELTWDVTGRAEGVYKFRIGVEDTEGRSSSQEYELTLGFSK